MKIDLPLDEMSIAEKIGMMETIWSDLSKAKRGYSPPEWHGSILKERMILAESGDVGFTDWDQAKKQIEDRLS